MLPAFDFIITSEETRTRPNAYGETINSLKGSATISIGRKTVYPWLTYKIARGKIAIQENKVSPSRRPGGGDAGQNFVSVSAILIVY